jgi:multicomponent Na+:H+ antiporter subunit D
MSQEVILPFAVSLVTAAGAVVLRNREALKYWSSAGGIVYTGSIGLLAYKVFSSGAVTYQAGSWPAPFGITLIADQLSVLMLSLAAVVSLSSLIYSHNLIGESGSFNAFLHFMLAGMTGAFLSGDLFNLFVWFEVVLMSSYAMVAFYGGSQETYSTLKYVIINLLGSSLMLVSIGGLYSITGTLNMADMGLRLSNPAQHSIPTAGAPGLLMLLFTVFALKSGLPPFHFWVPEAYTSAPAPATALMAGVSKKIGIYAVIRLFLGVFSGAELGLAYLPFGFETLLGGSMIVASASAILLGGSTAITSEKLGEMLSYSSVSQVGFIYLVLGAGFLATDFRNIAVIAALVYILNHGLAKSSLFMVNGILKESTGTDRIEELGGLSGRVPLVAATFFLAGFSLVGVPPLLGFFGKLTVFQSLVNSGLTILLPLAVIGSFMTLTYVSSSWKEVFWSGEIEVRDLDRLKVAGAMIGALCLVAAGFGFEIIYQASELAAEAVLSETHYFKAVLGDVE